MSVNSHTEAVSRAAMRAQLARVAKQNARAPVQTLLTELMSHGGIYSLLDTDLMQAQIAALAAPGPGRTKGPPPIVEIGPLVSAMQSQAGAFFIHLVQDPCPIPSSLMSRIAMPYAGTTFTPKDQDDKIESRVSAAFTFMGQFIDHDLTMNALDLFVPQTGLVQDVASPLIDLDSVYGPRTGGFSPPSELDFPDIYDGARFALRYRRDDGVLVVDLPRVEDRDDPSFGKAYIADKRNDENQLLLQVHLLIMRFHNLLIDQGLDFADAYHETLFTWQAIVRYDYLPNIADPFVVAAVERAMLSGDFKSLHNVPDQNLGTGALSVSMPHEFAIGFRFGHSQLRTFYPIRPDREPVQLFDNSLTADKDGAFSDLRGSQPLAGGHVIDWDYFLDPEAGPHSNLIDTKVTRVVFDLPESAIPDDITYIGNLPHRNLIRSRQIGVCSGEALAKLYDLTPLAPTQVEADPEARRLFETSGSFETPLWYYILKEAELHGNGGLGPAASHLISEVLLGGIHYNIKRRRLPPTWESKIFKRRELTFAEFACFVADYYQEQ